MFGRCRADGHLTGLEVHPVGVLIALHRPLRSGPPLNLLRILQPGSLGRWHRHGGPVRSAHRRERWQGRHLSRFSVDGRLHFNDRVGWPRARRSPGLSWLGSQPAPSLAVAPASGRAVLHGLINWFQTRSPHRSRSAESPSLALPGCFPKRNQPRRQLVETLLSSSENLIRFPTAAALPGAVLAEPQQTPPLAGRAP